jgi:pimeloyl-ACP methyl ester carboxylesterase
MITSERMTVHGIDLEVLRGGSGDPIVLLHGLRSLTASCRFPSLLTAHGAVVAPSCPGFGESPRPKDLALIALVVGIWHAKTSFGVRRLWTMMISGPGLIASVA